MIQLIPRYYPTLIPGTSGGPLYWRNEESGRLPAAVNAYLDHCLDRSNPGPTPEQLALLIDYCDYWVHAPCWRVYDEISQLRQSIKRVCTLDELREWMHRAMTEGIDPL